MYSQNCDSLQLSNVLCDTSLCLSETCQTAYMKLAMSKVCLLEMHNVEMAVCCVRGRLASLAIRSYRQSRIRTLCNLGRPNRFANHAGCATAVLVHRTGSPSYASRGWGFQVTLIMMSHHEGWLSSKCLGCCDRYFLVVAWAPEFRQTPARRCSYPHQGI